jgi:hypothetical protein
MDELTPLAPQGHMQPSGREANCHSECIPDGFNVDIQCVVSDLYNNTFYANRKKVFVQKRRSPLVLFC